MEEALLARLLAASPIAAIVGDRVDWDDRSDPMPSLTLTKVSPGREWTHDGPDGLDDPRVQFDCWASTKAARTALARAVLAEMEQPRVAAGWRFHEGSVELERWTREDDLPGEIPVFRAQLDFTFFHQEA